MQELQNIDAKKLSSELLDAVEKNNLDEVKRILDVQERIVAILKEFEEKGEDPTEEISEEAVDIVNKVRKDDQKTALLLAVDKGHTEIVKLLIQNPALTTLGVDKNGCTALHNAVRLGRVDIVEILLTHPTEVQIQLGFPCTQAPFETYTPIHFACSYSSADKQMDKVVTLFLDKFNVDVGIKTKEGDTPLHIAAQCSSYLCAMILLEHKASLTAKNSVGRTPLMIAAGLGSEEMTRLLLRYIESTEDLNIVDRLGDNAFHFAFQAQLQRVFKDGFELTFHHESCAYALARAGIDIDKKCNEGYLGTDFCSDNLGTILRMANKYPKLLPPTLQQILSMRLNMLSTMESDDRKKFEEALENYKAEVEAVEKQNQNMGSCPVNKGNPHLKRKTAGIVDTPATMQHGYGSAKPAAPPAFVQMMMGQKPGAKSGEEEEEAAAAVNSKSGKKKKKQQKKSDCPFGYIGDASDAAKYGASKQDNDDDEEEEEEDEENDKVTAEDEEEEADNVEADDEDDDEKCPIPYAPALVFLFTKNFWLGVAFGVLACKVSARFGLRK